MQLGLLSTFLVLGIAAAIGLAGALFMTRPEDLPFCHVGTDAEYADWLASHDDRGVAPRPDGPVRTAAFVLDPPFPFERDDLTIAQAYSELKGRQVIFHDGPIPGDRVLTAVLPVADPTAPEVLILGFPLYRRSANMACVWAGEEYLTLPRRRTRRAGGSTCCASRWRRRTAERGRHGSRRRGDSPPTLA
ncbi:hypothetical protein JAN5088_00530 [Jannaschia rubra]|uniref:Uncharacterized protein n=2 Tax=Jannaschia rubra TaxID=282197 RepID=A0A0M6XNK0_9RHOB|nr:hypothetical protein JAN5088_00530 [Jannaschia rubra]